MLTNLCERFQCVENKKINRRSVLNLVDDINNYDFYAYNLKLGPFKREYIFVNITHREIQFDNFTAYISSHLTTFDLGKTWNQSEYLFIPENNNVTHSWLFYSGDYFRFEPHGMDEHDANSRGLEYWIFRHNDAIHIVALCLKHVHVWQFLNTTNQKFDYVDAFANLIINDTFCDKFVNCRNFKHDLMLPEHNKNIIITDLIRIYVMPMLYSYKDNELFSFLSRHDFKKNRRVMEKLVLEQGPYIEDINKLK